MVKPLLGGVKVNSFNYLTNYYSAFPEDLYGIASNVISMVHPWYHILHLFSEGKWLNTYELPFFGDTYLEAQTADNWNTAGMAEALGSASAGGAGNIISSIAKHGVSLDFPLQPEFKLASLR